MKTATKRVVYALAALAVAAGVAVLFLPAPIEVDVAAVSTGSLVVTIDEDGETRAHDRFVVSAPVAGRVSRIELHEGDPVKVNQVVAEIWPLPLSARERDEQLAGIQSAQAQKNEADEQGGTRGKVFLKGIRDRRLSSRRRTSLRRRNPGFCRLKGRGRQP